MGNSRFSFKEAASCIDFPKIYMPISAWRMYSRPPLCMKMGFDQNKNQPGSRCVSACLGRTPLAQPTTNLGHIRQELDALASLATPIRPSVKTQWSPGLRSTGTNVSGIQDRDVRQVPNEEKAALLQSYLPCGNGGTGDHQLAGHLSGHLHRKAVLVQPGHRTCALTTSGPVWSWALPSPQGTFPRQTASTLIRRIFPVWPGAKRKCVKKITPEPGLCQKYRTVVPGTYTCVFSPVTAGVFAHSFGHKVRPT